MSKRVVIDGSRLTIDEVHRVARLGAPVALSPQARRKASGAWRAAGKLMGREESRGGAAPGEAAFPRFPTAQEAAEQFRKRVPGACSPDPGNAEPEDVVRAAMLCRANALAKGRSVVRPATIDAYIGLLNRGVTPLVIKKGAAGTSGEGPCLSEITEVLIGQGEAFLAGELMPAALALKKVHLEPVIPAAGETLALLGGSSMTTGEFALRCRDAETLLKNAVVASAMTIDALGCAAAAFDSRIHDERPFAGQIAVAAGIRRMTQGSGTVAAPRSGMGYGYSLRCAPQILSPSLDTLAFVRRLVTIEMNAAADGTLFYAEDRIALAGGNFHGQPIAMAADFLGIALSEVADLSERHTNRLLNPALSGLPPFLSTESSASIGLKEAQRAAATLASENKVLAHPAVADSISIAADEEDHVSMGSIAVRKLNDICDNVTIVIAIEMMCAAQAVDLGRPRKPGQGVRAACRSIRKVAPHFSGDRAAHCDIEAIAKLVASGEIVRAVERAVGPLGLGEYPS